MATRVLLGILLLWLLTIGHYFWSASKLKPVLGEVAFNATESVSHRARLLPTGRYMVVFWLPYGLDTDELDHSRDRRRILNELRKGQLQIEVKVTGAFGRTLVSLSDGYASERWTPNLRSAFGPNTMLWRRSQEATFIANPLERYTVSARIHGDNAFLSERTIGVGLSAWRDDGYHGLGHVILLGLSGLLFALIAIAWIFVQLTAVAQRWR